MVRRAALSTALILVAGVLTALAPGAAPAAPSASNAAAQGGSGAEPDPGFGRAQRAAAMAEARRDAPALAKSLGLGKAESLAARSVERDADGTEHVRYDRTLDGIPVIGGDLVVHEKASGAMAGVDYAASGPISAVRTDRPPVGAKAATAVAGRGQGLAQGSVGGAERVIWAVSGQPRLAWQVHVRGVDRQGAPVKRVEYVDAVSGDHIAGWSELEYATATGSGKSLYSGKVSLTTVKKGKGNKRKFLLKDPKRGNSTTVDVQNKEDGTRFLAGKLFTDKDNKWGNGKASNRQSAAVDVAFGAAKTWDYYKTAFSRKGIRGNNKGAKSRVHYGNNYDNAFWDDDCFCMTYGDGGDLFRPLVALDVAGHEMTHGITSNTAGLIYFGESGGLNEATSDIFGTMVEFYANRSADKGDYYIGEKIAKVSGLGTPFLRRMDDPDADGASYNCWTINMGADDVHLSSGPANKFFYMLSEGTAPKTIGGRAHDANPCTGPELTGIGRGSASKIWWRALTRYMTSTTSYIDARDATIHAALDLNDAQCAAVEAAWNAVNVPAGYWTCADGQLDEGASVLGANPGFESGATGWTFNANAEVTNDPGFFFPHSGTRWAIFNGFGSANVATATRSVTVPNTGAPMLRFHLFIISNEGIVTAFDTFDVTVNGTPVGAAGHFDNRSQNNTYIRYDVPMAAWANQTVTLGFQGQEDASVATLFLLDDVTLTPR